MKQSEIYNGHAGRFHRMAEHIELSMTPQHQQRHGGLDPITTNDITLATTLMNSVYGYPAGKQSVLALSAGMIPGEERSQTVRGALHDDCRMFGVRPDCHIHDPSTSRP